MADFGSLTGLFQGNLNHSDLVVRAEHIHAALYHTQVPALLSAAWDAFTSRADAFASTHTHTAAAVTTLSVPALNAAVDGLAESVGQDTATLRYLLTMFLAFPLGLLQSFLPPILAHLYNLVIGVFLAQFVFGEAWVHPLLSAAVTYAILVLGGVVPGLKNVRHILVFVWMMAYMTCVHLYRMHVDYLGWSLDVSGPQMVLTMKLTALAYNIFDGQRNTQEKYKRMVEKNPKMARIIEDRTRRSLPGVPNPLEYFGFVFCFTSFFAGPAFEFSEYARSIRGETFIVSAPNEPKKYDYQYGSRIKAAVTKLAVGLVFLAITAVLGPKFSFETVLSYENLHGPASNLLSRIGWTWLCLFITRTKYYFAWSFGEGSSILAGYGYQGKGVWNGVNNIDVLGFEFAPDVTAATKAWNKHTQSWLARYCGQRVDRAWSKLAVYSLSAFWHGFYPGYYLFFLSAPLIQALEGEIKLRIKPRVDAMGGIVSTVYAGLSFVAVSLLLNYMVCPFVALDWDLGLTVWASFYFVGHIVCIVLIALLKLVPAPRRKDGAKGKAE